ncbi:MAG: hypothetical protein IKH00_04290 [Bacteroidales bacterium]|nr:hypothetical protein [Bacteroidales bacterium]
MLKWLVILVSIVLTSLFLFPIVPAIMPWANTKMILAAIGLFIFVVKHLLAGSAKVSKDFAILSSLAILVSAISYFTMVFNGTKDSTFTDYIVSVWVWLGGAYFLIWLYTHIHGKVNVKLISNYLIAVCVAQCILAYMMTVFPALGSTIDSLFGESESYMGLAEDRMHGLGAALDPAGLKFSAILVLTSFLIANNAFPTTPVERILYVISLLVIAIIGNMISRSTTVGLIISIIYLTAYTILSGDLKSSTRFFISFSGIVVLGALLVIYLYRTNTGFMQNLRFGFEGFFSIAEKGYWETNSNNILKNMIVWPESLKTWIIGDGYIENPASDPNFLGEVTGGYYRGTDIGYLRYIFYFGIIGLAALIAVFIKSTKICIDHFKGYKILFLLMLLSNLVCWLKVSSDTFSVFAPFLCLAFIEDDNS